MKTLTNRFIISILIFGLGLNPNVSPLLNKQHVLAPHSTLTSISKSIPNDASSNRLETQKLIVPLVPTLSRQPLLVFLFFTLLLLNGCSSMTPAEQTAFINKRIEEKIQAKEDGNSYNLAVLADERWDLVIEMLDDGKSIDQIAEILELLGERRKLFVDYKILVDGAKK